MTLSNVINGPQELVSIAIEILYQILPPLQSVSSINSPSKSFSSSLSSSMSYSSFTSGYSSYENEYDRYRFQVADACGQSYSAKQLPAEACSQSTININELSESYTDSGYFSPTVCQSMSNSPTPSLISHSSFSLTNSDLPAHLPPLSIFINRIIRLANVSTTTFVATLVYLHRIKLLLKKNGRVCVAGKEDARWRLFIGALIVAGKMWGDESTSAHESLNREEQEPAKLQSSDVFHLSPSSLHNSSYTSSPNVSTSATSSPIPICRSPCSSMAESPDFGPSYSEYSSQPISSKILSHITGIYTPIEIAKIERTFLKLIDFDLWINPSHIESMLKEYNDVDGLCMEKFLESIEMIDNLNY
ncbi:hypothetical protein BKA69DRAFT_508215 [Paraphysoderma sedebokerense]|nr:hypothetical protein BKA69DRAFT_508215 [Paraphysoderma sedebokerense]